MHVEVPVARQSDLIWHVLRLIARTSHKRYWSAWVDDVDGRCMMASERLDFDNTT